MNRHKLPEASFIFISTDWMNNQLFSIRTSPCLPLCLCVCDVGVVHVAWPYEQCKPVFMADSFRDNFSTFEAILRQHMHQLKNKKKHSIDSVFLLCTVWHSVAVWVCCFMIIAACFRSTRMHRAFYGRLIDSSTNESSAFQSNWLLISSFCSDDPPFYSFDPLAWLKQSTIKRLKI